MRKRKCHLARSHLQEREVVHGIISRDGIEIMSSVVKGAAVGGGGAVEK